MRYRPRIFIRDYGAPTRRELLYANSFLVGGGDVGMRRGLFLRIDNSDAGEPGILLSGDAQTGADLLELSGEDGFLIRSSDANIRVFFSEVQTTIRSLVLLSGDAQSGNDGIELSGDMQSGADLLVFRS